jgi:hypothetical protein
VPSPRVAAPKTFIKEEERVQQLRRCLSAKALPGIVRTVGALVLLFGFPYTRLLGLTIHDVIVSGDAVELGIDGHSLRLPPRVDQLLLEQRKVSAERWTINQTASTTPWLFPGQEPARPIRSEYLGLLLRRHGFEGLASRNSARLALASDLPASVLANEHQQRHTVDRIREAGLVRLHRLSQANLTRKRTALSPLQGRPRLVARAHHERLLIRGIGERDRLAGGVGVCDLPARGLADIPAWESA